MDLPTLFAAACALFGSGCDLPLPEVIPVPESVMLERYCGDECGEGTGLYGLYDSRVPDVIMIDEKMTGRKRDMIVVHELIHYFQQMTRDPWARYRALDEHYQSLDPASAYAVRVWQLRELAKHQISSANECEAYKLAEQWNQQTGGVPQPIPGWYCE